MKYLDKIFKFYIFLCYIILLSKQEINKLIEGTSFAIIFNANDEYYNVITSNYIYVLNKQNNSIKFQKDAGMEFNSKPFLLKKSDNIYNLLVSQTFYNIILNEYNEISGSSFESGNLINFQCSGYFSEKLIPNPDFLSTPISPQQNENIIYGIKDKNFYFYYFSVKQNKIAKDKEYGTDLRDLSCKMFELDKFICSLNIDESLGICVFSCSNNSNNCSEEYCRIDESNEFFNGVLYDTLNTRIKTICADKRNNFILMCARMVIDPINGTYDINTFFDLSPDYNTNNCKTINCDFNQFYSEYLLCCACINYIICTRLDINFKKINNFKFDIEGENSNLQIFDNEKYMSIYFINNHDDSTSLNRKNIYPPICQNLTVEIKKEIEINFKELFDRKLDSNYYLTFIEFDADKLSIKFNNNDEYLGIGDKAHINNNNDLNILFRFILKNGNELSNHLIITYNISIDETYNSICSIDLIINNTDIDLTTIIRFNENANYNRYSTDLVENKSDINLSSITTHNEDYIISSTIKPLEVIYSTNIVCHQNCQSCYTIPELNNNNEIINQNCINCIEGYHLLSNTTNCYNDSILSQGYYLSSMNYEYYKCNDQCRTCKEISINTNSNCLSCYNNTFLFSLNNSCIYSCPNNYEANNELNKCELKNLEQASLEEFKNEIMNNISSFINSTNVINCSDFIAAIYDIDNSNPKEQLKNGISAIDLGNCTNKIKDFYKIDDFIVLNMESKHNKSEKNENGNDNSLNIGKNNQIEIYDYSGKKLNLSICNEDIKIMKYFKFLSNSSTYIF